MHALSANYVGSTCLIGNLPAKPIKSGAVYIVGTQIDLMRSNYLRGDLVTEMTYCAGSNIKLLRESKAMSRQDLAAKIGTSVQAVYNWENGKNTPTVESAAKLADIFGCTLDWLIGRDK